MIPNQIGQCWLQDAGSQVRCNGKPERRFTHLVSSLIAHLTFFLLNNNVCCHTLLYLGKPPYGITGTCKKTKKLPSWKYCTSRLP